VLYRLKCHIREIFSSVQGEGPYLGMRQIFVRFEGCNLACHYCDTKTYGKGSACSVEVDPGRKKFIEADNPMSSSDLLGIITGSFDLSLHQWVSITGGEPLLQAGYLMELLPGLRDLGLRIYLETNGTLPDNLGRIVDMVDVVAMDIKLPGTSGCQPMWNQHSQFLAIARRTGVFVKIVVDDGADLSEYDTALDLLSRIDTSITLVIQPVTLSGKCMLSPGRALYFQSMALKRLRDVRIIPQAHKMMDQL